MHSQVKLSEPGGPPGLDICIQAYDILNLVAFKSYCFQFFWWRRSRSGNSGREVGKTPNCTAYRCRDMIQCPCRAALANAPPRDVHTRPPAWGPALKEINALDEINRRPITKRITAGQRSAVTMTCSQPRARNDKTQNCTAYRRRATSAVRTGIL